MCAHSEEKIQDAEDKKLYLSITGAIIHLEQYSRYNILFAVNQLAKAMSNPSKAHMGPIKHLHRYLAGSVNLSTTYNRGGFKLAAYSDANGGNNPENGKSTSIIVLANDPISFKVHPYSQTVQSTSEAELMAEALAMKEALFFSNMIMELGFEK